MSALTPAGSTRLWRKLRRFVLDRDGWRCQLLVDAGGRHVEDGDPAADRRCLAYADHVDHVVPRAAGGSDHPENLRAACRVGNLGRRPDRSTDPASHDRRPGRARGWSW